LGHFERAFAQGGGGDDDFFGLGFLGESGVTDEQRHHGDAQ
jgi:hypothetical protein